MNPASSPQGEGRAPARPDPAAAHASSPPAHLPAHPETREGRAPARPGRAGARPPSVAGKSRRLPCGSVRLGSRRQLACRTICRHARPHPLFLFSRLVAHPRFSQMDGLLEIPRHTRLLGIPRLSRNAHPPFWEGRAPARPSRAAARLPPPPPPAVPKGLLGHPTPERRQLLRKMGLRPPQSRPQRPGRDARGLALARRNASPPLARLTPSRAIRDPNPPALQKRTLPSTIWEGRAPARPIAQNAPPPRFHSKSPLEIHP